MSNDFEYFTTLQTDILNIKVKYPLFNQKEYYYNGNVIIRSDDFYKSKNLGSKDTNLDVKFAN